MKGIQARFVGVELYFEDLEKAKKVYVETLGLETSDEEAGHHARFDGGEGFVELNTLTGPRSAPKPVSKRRVPAWSRRRGLGRYSSFSYCG